MAKAKAMLNSLTNIVIEASRLMQTEDFSISQKGSVSNIVTSSDIAVQEFLCRKLSTLLPGCGFICEEEDMRDTQHEYLWIIDPIDGTANYARGIRECGICVGLWHEGRMELAAVYRKQYARISSEIILETFLQCNDIRRFGSAASELCYLALGHCELYFEYMLSPWDFAAASLILEEAGGVLCNLEGQPLDYTKPSGVLGGNSQESLQRLVQIVKSKNY